VLEEGVRTRPILALAGLLALGCSDPFTPDYRLVKARVLALQADPPQPQLGESTTLRALLYLPDGTGTPSFHWTWCPAPTSSDDGYGCPIDQAGFDQLMGSAAGQAPSLDLGTGETAVFANPFPADMLAALCSGNAALASGRGAAGDAGDSSVVWSCGTGGFPITVRLELQTPSMDKVAAAVFKIYLPTDATQPGNNNPIVGGVSIVDPPPSGVPDDSGLPTLKRHLQYKIALDMDTSVSETFIGWTIDSLGGWATDDAGKHIIGSVQEIISVKWYVEGGDLGDDAGNGGADTGYNPYATTPLQTIADANENYWKTPKQSDYDKMPASVIVVIRDNRGGVNWTSAAFNLETQP
jgi:hypothetical protein